MGEDKGGAGEVADFLSWLTILAYGVTRRCDLHILRWRELDVRTM